MIFKSREWYYIISIDNYHKLSLFLILVVKFDQKSNFIHELGLIRAE